jgi:hypothetical protein
MENPRVLALTTRARTLLRALGLSLVLLAVYHLFGPLFVSDLPTWAPWRVIGPVLVGDGAAVLLGDVLALAGGAAVVWFV